MARAFRRALALTSTIVLAAACAPSPQATAPPAPTVAPTASAAAAGGPLFQKWTRVDLPDPAPGAYGGAAPSSVAAFKGGFVAVGSVASCCTGIDMSLAHGVIWTSVDGRAWTLLDPIAVFDHAELGKVWSDGARLIVTGVVAASATDPEKTAPAVWVSADGVTWMRSTDPVPSEVTVGGSGMLGAMTTYTDTFGVGTVRFVSSADGLSWTSTSRTYAVLFSAMAASPDGSAIALGLVPGPARADGSGSSNVVALRSTDGRSWTAPEVIVRDALPTALLRDAEGFLAFGSVSTLLPDGTLQADVQLWRFDADGRLVTTPIPLADGDGISSVFVAHDALVAMVRTAGEAPGIRVSTDGGVTWVPVPELDPFDALEPSVRGAVETSGGLLAVGSRWDGESTHRLPVAWISDR